MAIQVWTDMSVLVGAAELRGLGRNVACSTEVVALDKTNYASDGWTEVIGGLKSGTVNLDLMQDRAAGGLDELAWSYFGTAGIPKSVTSASVDGSVAYLMSGISLSYLPVDGEVGQLAMTRISGRSASSPVVRGRLLHPSTTARTSSGTGTGRQMGAVSSTKSIYLALHVVEVSGVTPSLTVKLQSDDNSGFTSATDRITCTAATDETYQWASLAGAVTDDYWRITYTISGTNPSFKFAVTAGIL